MFAFFLILTFLIVNINHSLAEINKILCESNGSNNYFLDGVRFKHNPTYERVEIYRNEKNNEWCIWDLGARCSKEQSNGIVFIEYYVPFPLIPESTTEKAKQDEKISREDYKKKELKKYYWIDIINLQFKTELTSKFYRNSEPNIYQFYKSINSGTCK
jgi:hypothetical protein